MGRRIENWAKRGAALAFAALLTVGCGSSGSMNPDDQSNGDGDGNGNGNGNGSGNGNGNAEKAPCTLDADYPTVDALTTGTGTLEVVAQEVDEQGNATDVLQFIDIQSPFPSGDADGLFVSLIGGLGGFEGGIPTGDLSIAAPNTSVSQCFACIGVIHGVGADARLLMAQSGTLTIDAAVTEGDNLRLAGSISDIALAEMNDSDFGATVKEGGCTTRIGSFSFDVALVAQDSPGTQEPGQ